MIKTVFLFPNGALACTDENGKQVPEEQSNILLDKLQDMYTRRVITPSTIIKTQQFEGPIYKLVNLDYED